MSTLMTHQMMFYILITDITRGGGDIPEEIRQGGERSPAKVQMDMKIQTK